MLMVHARNGMGRFLGKKGHISSFVIFFVVITFTRLVERKQGRARPRSMEKEPKEERVLFRDLWHAKVV